MFNNKKPKTPFDLNVNMVGLALAALLYTVALAIAIAIPQEIPNLNTVQIALLVISEIIFMLISVILFSIFWD